MTKLALANRLRELLTIGEVYFTFRKIDGSERKAHGTLNQSLFSYQFVGKGNPSADVIPYWDLDKNAWRSCRIDSLLSIDE